MVDDRDTHVAWRSLGLRVDDAGVGDRKKIAIGAKEFLDSFLAGQVQAPANQPAVDSGNGVVTIQFATTADRLFCCFVGISGDARNQNLRLSQIDVLERFDQPSAPGKRDVVAVQVTAEGLIECIGKTFAIQLATTSDVKTAGM